MTSKRSKTLSDIAVTATTGPTSEIFICAGDAFLIESTSDTAMTSDTTVTSLAHTVPSSPLFDIKDFPNLDDYCKSI